MASRRALLISASIALTTWIVWLACVGPDQAIGKMVAHWEVAATMIFGSLIAGATSEGGGAVAFPVFTKALGIAPQDAKVFALAIQSVGMTAASICIIMLRIRVDWRAICYASLGGVFGIFLSLGVIAPHLSPPVVRIFFTAMQVSFAVTLVILNCTDRFRVTRADLDSTVAKQILFVTGIMGGLATGLVGNGIDLVTFFVLVMLFGVSEKVATPTSVVLMAINAMIGFLACGLFFGGFDNEVKSMWLSAIPVVVVGAPAGAILCSLLRRETIVRILVGLIAIELGTSLWLIPMTGPVIITAVVTLTCCVMLSTLMLRWRRFRHGVRQPVGQ